MTKEQLLAELEETFVVLKPSTTHGVGVFAIRDIPKGARNLFSKHHEEWIKLPLAEWEVLPQYSKDLIENYCVYDKEFYYIEKSGFKKRAAFTSLQGSKIVKIALIKSEIVEEFNNSL